MSALNELVKRTNGDGYIGVVGPVCVGKSTLISKLLEHLILPSIEEAEQEIVAQLKSLGKPFVLLINSESPFSEETQRLVGQLKQRLVKTIEKIVKQEQQGLVSFIL